MYPTSRKRVPRELSMPPRLRADLHTGAPTSRYALLINPFYPKDPHASFGKHVLTPSLALTSIAGATPENWDVRYWDENLLQGPPASEPLSDFGSSVWMPARRNQSPACAEPANASVSAAPMSAFLSIM